jgi:hypothetical protein
MKVDVRYVKDNHYMVVSEAAGVTDEIGYVVTLMNSDELFDFMQIDAIVARRDEGFDLSDTELTLLKLAGRLTR